MKKAVYSFLLMSCIAWGAYSQQAPGLIEVTGISAAEELPEELAVNIPLIVIDSTYLSCSQRLNGLLAELKKDLDSRGVDRESLSTGNYSISENYEYRQGERKRMGYKGQVTLNLTKKYEPKLVDEFLQAAEKFSLQYTVRFVLSEEQKDKLTSAALAQAFEDAERKAQILARASGVQLESISKISYGGLPSRPGPEAIRLSADAGGTDSNGLRLYPGPVSVNQTVRVTWQISQ